MKAAHCGAKYTRGRSPGRPHRRIVISVAGAAALSAIALLILSAASYARPRREHHSPVRTRSGGSLLPRRELSATGERQPATAIWGFTAPWDPRSAASVAVHGSALRVVVTGWLRLDTTSALPALAYPDTVHVPRGPRRFAIVTTYARDRFHPEIIRRLGADSALRARVAGAIADAAASGGYRGLVLDFETLTPADTASLSAVVRTVADSAHRRHLRPVAVAVPPADTLTYGARHLRAADLLLVMLYDEHWSTGAAGPIASPDWVRQHLALWIANAGASRLIVALPLYGYLWKPPAPATVLSFADAERMAGYSHAALTRDSASSALHFTRADSAEGWVSDATLLRQLMRTVDSLGVHRVALWRLGLEDPAIWSAMRHH